MLTFDEINEILDNALRDGDKHILLELEDDTFLCIDENNEIIIFTELDENGYGTGEEIISFGELTENSLEEISNKVETYLSDQGISGIVVECGNKEVQEETIESMEDDFTTQQFNAEYENVLRDLDSHEHDNDGICIFCEKIVEPDDLEKAKTFVESKNKYFDPKSHCICKECLTEFTNF
jgi:hypothetical protein